MRFYLRITAHGPLWPAYLMRHGPFLDAWYFQMTKPEYECIQLVLIMLTYVFPAAILLCVYKYDVCGLAPFFYYNTSLVFHLESSNENLK